MATRTGDASLDRLRLRATAEDGVRAMLRLMGDDPARDGLKRTPHRVVKAMLEMTTPPLPDDPGELLATKFDCKQVDQMVTVGGVSFTSLCEHHLSPFTGRAWIAYLPSDGFVVGLSKLPRVLDYYAARPQVQERLAQQVTAALVEHVGPDAACVLDGVHSCMSTRGARKPGAVMRSSSLTGKFRDDPAVRAEFLAMVGTVQGA
jgi:GTP cyclohydrolase IA